MLGEMGGAGGAARRALRCYKSRVAPGVVPGPRATTHAADSVRR